MKGENMKENFFYQNRFNELTLAAPFSKMEWRGWKKIYSQNKHGVPNEDWTSY